MGLRRAGTAIAGLLVVVLLFTCGENGPSDEGDSGVTNTKCAKGLKAMGPACVPIFDECKEDEVPMLGGGCKRVGPPRTCLKGWEKVKGGWCEPILPKTKCPLGTMEVIGKSTCQPIGDCGSGTWGNIKTSAKTIYVDQNSKGTSGLGTQAQPYLTIAAALNQAMAGDHIAVAAGTYKEDVSIIRKVALEGRCAQMVTILGGGNWPAVWMKKWASGSILRGVTITGAETGLNVDSVDVSVERVVVQRCQERGIQVAPGGVLTLRDSVVVGNREAGVAVFSAKAILERTVVRDTRERASDKSAGVGIMAMLQPGQSRLSELTIRDSLVAGNRFAGILLESSKAKVERTVIRDTRERASDKKFGFGIEGWVQSGQSVPSELAILDSIVAGNRYIGIALFSSKGTVERTVVRDTHEQVSDNGFGTGIQASIQSGQKHSSELTIRDSMVVRNRYFGIVLQSSKATLERLIVQNTLGQKSDGTLGIGIQVSVKPGHKLPSELTARDTLVAENRFIGIIVSSSKAILERMVVRDTREQVSDDTLGTGIEVWVESGLSRPSELTIRDSLVTRNRNTGIFVSSSKATIERVVVCDTVEQASDKYYGSGIVAKRQPGESLLSNLSVRDSLIVRNRSTGIALYRSNGKLSRCAVSDTRKDGRGGYGDGVVGEDSSTLDVVDHLVERSARAGFLFVGSKGTVHRSLIRRNVFAIDLEKGARPTIGTDNVMVDNQVNKVSTGRGLKVAPVPSAPNPLGLDAGTKKGPDAGVGTP